MSREEFEKRTGYFPSLDEYAVIEEFYMNFIGDKDEFCKAYKKNADGLASKIQLQTDKQRISALEKTNRIMEQYQNVIKNLELQIEQEQEWKPYEDTCNVNQDDYEKLAKCMDTKVMSDEEAKDLLYGWFGFAKEKVTILHSVPIYETNRHRQRREVGKLDRHPLYNATDWNYIRFDCGCMCYELDNDNLRMYMQ